jgi:microcystin-dependent protein
VSTLDCSYELDEDDDVGTKNMELKVVSPIYSNRDTNKASLILHYDYGSGSAHPTYARLFVQNLGTQQGNMAYVEVTEAQADSDVILYSEGTTFRLHGHDGFGALKGNLLVEGNAGMIQMYAGQYPPKGWLFCDGTAIGREAYPKLFAVIGTTYGEGDGSTTFNLPDFRDRFPVGAGTTYVRNSKGGAGTVTLTTSQIPAHTHGKSGAITGGITGGSHTHSMKSIWSDGSGSSSAYTMSSNRKQTTRSTDSQTHTHNLPAHEHTSVCGGQAHENRPPYIGINFIICTGKLYY